MSNTHIHTCTLVGCTVMSYVEELFILVFDIWGSTVHTCRYMYKYNALYWYLAFFISVTHGDKVLKPSFLFLSLMWIIVYANVDKLALLCE